VVNGQRILPAGWVAFSASPTFDAPGDKEPALTACRRMRGFASGMNGQRIIIVPSKHLVVVRFGSIVDPPQLEMKDLARLIADVSDAIH